MLKLVKFKATRKELVKVQVSSRIIGSSNLCMLLYFKNIFEFYIV